MQRNINLRSHDNVRVLSSAIWILTRRHWGATVRSLLIFSTTRFNMKFQGSYHRASVISSERSWSFTSARCRSISKKRKMCSSVCVIITRYTIHWARYSTVKDNSTQLKWKQWEPITGTWPQCWLYFNALSQLNYEHELSRYSSCPAHWICRRLGSVESSA